ncbi:MAG: hypothetical protein KA054_00865 [Candidatus Moranbacteria bacterium]|nr:hypothetical protein [Candidatus Moranbacteria bacterium]
MLLVLSAGFYVSADEQGITPYSLFQDADQDGLSDEEERVFGTNPLIKDTDEDSYSDGIEVESGYDPLKSAPGDKLASSDSGLGKGGYDDVSTEVTTNVTKNASQEVVNMLSTVSAENPSVSMQDINASVEQLLQQSAVNVEFPDVDIKTIRVKEIGCKDSDSEEKCLKKKRDATIEYLTILSYVVANNSPISLKNNGDLDLAASSLVSDIMNAFATGNFSLILKNKSKAEAFLDNVKEIEVPENMVSTHMKALQLALFSVGLADAFGKLDNDPIGQISLLSQAQGLLGFATGLASEIQSEFKKLGIDLIPVDL